MHVLVTFSFDPLKLAFFLTFCVWIVWEQSSRVGLPTGRKYKSRAVHVGPRVEDLGVCDPCGATVLGLK